jgi:hypothetical protein
MERSMGDILTIISGIISLALTVWFVCFSILVVKKLNKLIELLGKNHSVDAQA